MRWLTRWLGNRGERAAGRFLRSQGLKVVARQYRNRYGEIDLLCRDGQTTVFVEVKTRSTVVAGHPAEAVTADKQRILTRTAAAYLKRRRLLDQPARFDVVAVVWPRDARRPEITWYRHAFEPTDLFGLY